MIRRVILSPNPTLSRTRANSSQYPASEHEELLPLSQNITSETQGLLTLEFRPHKTQGKSIPKPRANPKTQGKFQTRKMLTKLTNCSSRITGTLSQHSTSETQGLLPLEFRPHKTSGKSIQKPRANPKTQGKSTRNLGQIPKPRANRPEIQGKSRKSRANRPEIQGKSRKSRANLGQIPKIQGKFPKSRANLGQIPKTQGKSQNLGQIHCRPILIHIQSRLVSEVNQFRRITKMKKDMCNVKNVVMKVVLTT